MSTTRVALSRAFGATLYRWRTGTPRPHYAQVKGRDRCDECIARDHEGHVGTSNRRQARERRTLTAPDATRTLLLCGAHAELWRERDRGDGAPTGRSR